MGSREREREREGGREREGEREGETGRERGRERERKDRERERCSKQTENPVEKNMCQVKITFYTYSVNYITGIIDIYNSLGRGNTLKLKCGQYPAIHASCIISQKHHFII